ncbi:MAG: MBL fold metallo-hydrolase [Ignavibacteriae bacterium]|nr:MBL fold metallo-hydrolase [Ignavibacteriota bacterium]
MQIEFLGAAQTVTGSMHLLHINGKRILLDCGLFQGRRAESTERNRTFPFEPESIDAVILSHAHIDHSGNLPGLVKQGYSGPIFCTNATKDLCNIMLADSAHIQEKDAEFINKKHAKRHEPLVEPLYTPEDAVRAMESFQAIPYNKEFDVLPNVQAKFVDAGHILGSASIHLTIKESGTTKTLGFTGDIGRWNMPIIRDPQFIGNVEALISESTYGGILHDSPDDMEKNLSSVLHRTFERGGKVIVPAFSVGRTQDIVYALHRLKDGNNLPSFPIYIDSPLAINATEIFRKHRECYDEETRKHILEHHDPLGLSQLHYVRSAEESKQLNDKKEPCMIISASGMCEAGRIVHHLANNIEDARNTIMIVGYQAEHTLGRKLVEKFPEVKMFGEFFKLRAEVAVFNSFSAHADGNELLKYINKFEKNRLQQIYLVHGELERQVKLKQGLNGLGFTHVESPVRGKKFEL